MILNIFFSPTVPSNIPHYFYFNLNTIMPPTHTIPFSTSFHFYNASNNVQHAQSITAAPRRLRESSTLKRRKRREKNAVRCQPNELGFDGSVCVGEALFLLLPLLLLLTVVRTLRGSERLRTSSFICGSDDSSSSGNRNVCNVKRDVFNFYICAAFDPKPASVRGCC